jgi:hypothetical protein
MAKRNTSILLFSRTKCHQGWSSPSATVIFLASFVLILSCACEKQKGTEPKPGVKINSPPAIASVKILPEQPNRESDLSLLIQSQDSDGDSVSYQYQWIKNDEEIVGENGTTFKAGNLIKGDVIQVRVIPSDGKENGKPFLSDPVTILNSPPVTQEVWIEPKMPSAKDNLEVQEKSVDADDDTIYFTYQWEKNGVELMDERKEVLEQGRFKKGDSITVTIIPDDREIMGTPKKSAPVTITNSPPSIISSPPTSTNGTKYEYPVKAIDPDNDPLTFSLKSGPKGMKVDTTSGLVYWEIQKEDKGTHTIEIEVSDNEGLKSFQRYTLAIEFR